MNAGHILAMQTQLVIIQQDLICVHVILAILAMDLTAQVCIELRILETQITQYIYIVVKKNDEKDGTFLVKIISLFVSFAKILDINECWTYPCHANATCNNTIGSYMCACDTGYSGDGFNCTGIHN